MKLVCKTVFGSHLYGTATPISDKDIRGVFVPSAREILLGRIPKTNKDNLDPREGPKEDFEIFSLHHFLKLACEGQTLAIDMLWTPEHLIEKGEYYFIWEDLVSLRHKFLSKRMNAFIGYARSQAAKYSLKGERLNKLERFLKILLLESSEDKRLGDLWDQLPKDSIRINPQEMLEFQLAGKWFGKRTSVREAIATVDNIIARYGERANQAAECNGADWKALSHAVRVSLELNELLFTNNLKFPSEFSDVLLQIKQGKMLVLDVENLIDGLLKENERLMEKSNWPENVDRQFWDDWLCNVIEDTL